MTMPPPPDRNRAAEDDAQGVQTQPPRRDIIREARDSAWWNAPSPYPGESRRDVANRAANQTALGASRHAATHGLQQPPLTTPASAEAWPPPPFPTAGPMTPTRLRECLAIIGWSQRQLASMIAIDSSRVRRMATGEEPISPTLQAGLEELAEAHARVRLRREP
jgi:ribosome-binding protein aMBF1 (putative translation factor)